MMNTCFLQPIWQYIFAGTTFDNPTAVNNKVKLINC